MVKLFTDDNTRHECRHCLGTGIGQAEGIPCWHCRGKGMVDNRPIVDFDDNDELWEGLGDDRQV